MNIVNAVKLAIRDGGMYDEWRDARYNGKQVYLIHLINENFALCSGQDARNDYFAMWFGVKGIK